jgi:hypothetical protein
VDLWDLTKLIVRRWYIAVPILLVTLTGVLFASKSVRPDYSATGHLQLVPPAHPTESDAVKATRVHNPWLDLGIQALGSATIIDVQDERTIKELKREGFSEHILVSIDYPATFISIEVVGQSPAQATGTVQKVQRLLTDDVKAKQQQFGVVQEDMIGTLALDQGDKVTVVTSKIKRVLIVAAGMGMLITAAATIGIDAWLRRRARRKAEKPATAAVGGKPQRDDIDATTVMPAQRVNGTARERGRRAPERSVRSARVPADPAQPLATPAAPVKAATSPANKASVVAAKSKRGNLFRSTAADPAYDDQPTSVISAPHAGTEPHAGDGGEPADGSRDPVVVEYHQTDEERPDETAAAAADDDAGAAAGAGAGPARERLDDASEPLSVPSDATIVLPLPNKPWAAPGGNKRR